MTKEQMLVVIRKEIEKSGSQNKFASMVGCSKSLLSKVLGGMLPPTEAIIGPLGYVRETVTTYRKKK